MLAQLIHTLRHLFTPRSSNNHRPKLLYPKSLAVLAGIVVLANAGIQSFAQVTGGVLGYASDITVQQVLEQTNQERINSGLSPLDLSDQLSDAARRKAADMFTFDYWAHNNPQNGTQPWYFFDAVGYKYSFAGENLARDFATTTPMVQAWIDSKTHKDNLLSTKYHDTGIAVINGRLKGIDTTLVVQLFGTRQNQAAIPQVSTANTGSENSENSAGQIAGKSEIQKAENSEIPALRQSDLSSFPSFPKNYALHFSPLDISKSVALSTLFLIALVIAIDSVIIWRRKTRRLAGRNWAHLLFISVLIVVVGILNQGVIK